MAKSFGHRSKSCGDFLAISKQISAISDGDFSVFATAKSLTQIHDWILHAQKSHLLAIFSDLGRFLSKFPRFLMAIFPSSLLQSL